MGFIHWYKCHIIRTRGDWGAPLNLAYSLLTEAERATESFPRPTSQVLEKVIPGSQNCQEACLAFTGICIHFKEIKKALTGWVFESECFKEMEGGKSLFPCVQQGELSLLVLICICPQSVPMHLESLDQHSPLSEDTREQTQEMDAAKLALEKK